MRALVVDDSAAMRGVLRMVLRQCGCEVAGEAKHGKEAMALLSRIGPVDVALVDWNMPEMSGLEMLYAVRANPALDAMKIMMVTTETDLEQVEKALQCGADEYVMKPFNKDIIADKLHILGF